MQKDKIDIALDIILITIIAGAFFMLAYAIATDAQEIETPIETEKESSTIQSLNSTEIFNLKSDTDKIIELQERSDKLDKLLSKYAKAYDACRFSK